MQFKNRRTAVVVAVVLALTLVPLTVIAVGGTFVDDDTSIFEGDIEWLAASGVTKGCGNPADKTFCPDKSVTRGQMAAFMRRFAEYLGAEDGTPAQADNASKVGGKTAAQLDTATYATFHDGPIDTSFVDRTVLTLDVPAGSYVIFAKAWVENPSGTTATARCRITAAPDYDESQVGLAANSSVQSEAALSMMVVHTYATAGSAVLTCDERTVNSDIRVWDAKITAIEVTSLSNVFGG